MGKGRTNADGGNGKTKKSVLETAYQHKKWQRINWGIIKQIYVLREDEISMENLAKEFNITPPHLQEVAATEKWKLQRKIHQDKILLKCSEKLSDKIAEMRAKNVAITEGALSYLLQEMQSRNLRASVSDIDKMVRLLEFLHGNADSRTETAITTIERAIRDNQSRRVKEHEDINAIEAELTGTKPSQPLLPEPEEEGENDGA